MGFPLPGDNNDDIDAENDHSSEIDPMSPPSSPLKELPATPARESPQARTGSAPPKKRMTVAEQIAQTLADSRAAQTALVEAKYSSKKEIAQMRLAFQRDQEDRMQADRAAARAHELAMMERSIQLESIRRGMVVAPPAGGPNDNIDPYLR